MKKVLLYGLLISVAVMTRLFVLPVVTNHYVRNQLRLLTNYRASYESLSISLLKGKYSIKDFRLFENHKPYQRTFLHVKQIDFALAWDQLLRGKLMGTVTLLEPDLILIKPKPKKESNFMIDDHCDISRRLMILSIHEFKILNGKINYSDMNVFPRINLSVDRVNLLATNIQHKASDYSKLPGYAFATATAYGGQIAMEMHFNPFSETPQFNVQGELRNLNLESLTSYLLASQSCTIQGGIFSMFTEASVDDDYRISGFVRPLLETIDQASFQANQKNESKFRTTKSLFSRPWREIPFEKDLDFESSTCLWRAVGFTLHHAFSQALRPVIRHADSQHKRDVDSKPHMNPSIKIRKPMRVKSV